MINGDHLTLLYRGSLSSCNYACEYCPFSKSRASESEIDRDRAELNRFVEHFEQKSLPTPFSRLSVMFIPWGEALVHGYYHESIIRISKIPEVETIIIQTNLSTSPSWVENAEKGKLSFWCTFHPTQTDIDSFLNLLAVLDEHETRYSVGIVALEEFYDAAMRLRKKLPEQVSCWANPLDDNAAAYSREAVQRWTRFDPFFSHALKQRQTLGTVCRCGQSVFTVSGNGDYRRCPFVHETLGNIYSPDFPVKAEACPNETCLCFIGYIHWETENRRSLYRGHPLCRIAFLQSGVKSTRQ